MKKTLLVKVNCLDEFNHSVPGHGLLEITPEYARYLVGLYNAAEPLRRIGSFYSVEFWDPALLYVSVDSSDEGLKGFLETAEDEGYAELPANFDTGPALELRFEVARTSTNLVKLLGNHVCYTCYERYTDDPLESEQIPLSLFAEVAGYAPTETV